MSGLDELTKKIQETLAKGGSYCFECGIFFDTVIEARQHDLAAHYDYALAQCYGDKKLLLKWASGLDG